MLRGGCLKVRGVARGWSEGLPVWGLTLRAVCLCGHRCVYDASAFRWNVENYVEGVHTVEVRSTHPPSPPFTCLRQHSLHVCIDSLPNPLLAIHISRRIPAIRDTYAYPDLCVRVACR
jgi:hypothetical protein